MGPSNRRNFIARLASASLLLVAWPLASESAFAGKSVDGVPATALRDVGRLFRVSRHGLPDSYVLGTIHVPDPRVSTPTKPVLDALARCRSLAVELIADDGIELRELEQLDNGRRLESILGNETYTRLRHRIATGDASQPVTTEAAANAQATNAPIAEDALARMKPWAALMRASRSPVAVTAQATLDSVLLATARQRRMKILPLELIDEQVAAFDSIAEATQVALLKHALDNADALRAGARTSVDAWLRGDLDGLARNGLQDEGRFPAMRPHYAELVRHIIHDRTALMHHRLFVPLSEGRVFIAIGALHLQGSKGLLALLREDGYRIARVW